MNGTVKQLQIVFSWLLGLLAGWLSDELAAQSDGGTSSLVLRKKTEDSKTLCQATCHVRLRWSQVPFAQFDVGLVAIVSCFYVFLRPGLHVSLHLTHLISNKTHEVTDKLL